MKGKNYPTCSIPNELREVQQTKTVLLRKIESKQKPKINSFVRGANGVYV